MAVESYVYRGHRLRAREHFNIRVTHLMPYLPAVESTVTTYVVGWYMFFRTDRIVWKIIVAQIPTAEQANHLHTTGGFTGARVYQIPSLYIAPSIP